jgi:hypothetical protein
MQTHGEHNQSAELQQARKALEKIMEENEKLK